LIFYKIVLIVWKFKQMLLTPKVSTTEHASRLRRQPTIPSVFLW